MTWTTTPPTEPGWYWIEYNPSDRDLVEVDEDLNVWVAGEADYWSLLTHGGPSRWLGPIPEPEEA